MAMNLQLDLFGASTPALPPAPEHVKPAPGASMSLEDARGAAELVPGRLLRDVYQARAECERLAGDPARGDVWEREAAGAGELRVAGIVPFVLPAGLAAFVAERAAAFATTGTTTATAPVEAPAPATDASPCCGSATIATPADIAHLPKLQTCSTGLVVWAMSPSGVGFYPAMTGPHDAATVARMREAFPDLYTCTGVNL